MDETSWICVGIGVIALAGGICIGGAISDSVARGEHLYHAVRIVSVQGSTLVRAVQSPARVDDRTVETIIDGKLISRSKPVDFEAIWSKAK